MTRYSVLLLAALSLNAAAAPTCRVTPIAELEGHFFSASINNLGQVAGSRAIGTSLHGFLWERGNGGSFGPFVNDGGTFEPLTGITTARQINENDQVAGRLLFDSIYYHAGLLTHGGSVIDLGVLPGDQYSEVLGLNELGQSVGYSRPDLSSNTYRAFVWRDSVSGIQELLLLISIDDFVQAQAINDDGLAVGISGKATGLALKPRQLCGNKTAPYST